MERDETRAGERQLDRLGGLRLQYPSMGSPSRLLFPEGDRGGENQHDRWSCVQAKCDSRWRGEWRLEWTHYACPLIPWRDLIMELVDLILLSSPRNMASDVNAFLTSSLARTISPRCVGLCPVSSYLFGEAVT